MGYLFYTSLYMVVRKWLISTFSIPWSDGPEGDMASALEGLMAEAEGEGEVTRVAEGAAGPPPEVEGSSPSDGPK